MQNQKHTHNQPVSLIIPFYNGESLVSASLKSVLNCVRSGDEIILIDDASTDSTFVNLQHFFKLPSRSWTEITTRQQRQNLASQQVSDVFAGNYHFQNKSIRVIGYRQRQNLRFAKTVNQAVELAENLYILLFNSDVIPEKNVISELQSMFKQNQESTVFAVGCLELEPQSDGTVIHGGKNQLWFKRGMYHHSRATEFSSGPTAWVSGGSGMFSRRKWLELNGFDLRFYPAYWEDVDLSFRARKNGWQILFCDQAVVTHAHETTNQQVFGNIEITNLSWKHARYFSRKHTSGLKRMSYWFWTPYWWFKRWKAR